MKRTRAHTYLQTQTVQHRTIACGVLMTRFLVIKILSNTLFRT